MDDKKERRYNHGPLYRRPMWVSFFLRRIQSRQQGMFASWLGLFLGLALAVLACSNFHACVAGALLMVHSLGTSWAVWWVQKFDYWD